MKEVSSICLYSKEYRSALIAELTYRKTKRTQSYEERGCHLCSRLGATCKDYISMEKFYYITSEFLKN